MSATRITFQLNHWFSRAWRLRAAECQLPSLHGIDTPFFSIRRDHWSETLFVDMKKDFIPGQLYKTIYPRSYIPRLVFKHSKGWIAPTHETCNLVLPVLADITRMELLVSPGKGHPHVFTGPMTEAMKKLSESTSTEGPEVSPTMYRFSSRIFLQDPWWSREEKDKLMRFLNELN